MCTDDTWPYWIELAVCVIALVGATVVAYGSRDPVRQKKYWLVMLIYGASALVAGSLALGQAQTVRSDGVCVVWGRWALFAATHGAVAVLIVVSTVTTLIDAALAMMLGSGSALALLFGALTPLRNGGNDESAAILWTVGSGVCVLALAALLAGIVLGWRRFVLFPAPYRATDGTVNVINRWWYLALTLGAFLLYSLYTILYALGPEGWHVYGQFTQTWLTMALADTIKLVLVVPLVFLYLNADGSPSTDTAFEALAPADAAPQVVVVTTSVGRSLVL
jgi:hypothetical protein